MFDELPTYAQARQAMKPLAKSMLQRLQITNAVNKKTEEEIRGLDPRIMQGELSSLDARWKAGERSEEILRRAASATTRLLFVAFDAADVTDPLATQAVALMALAQAQGVEMPLEESMLAWRLGYRSHAIAAAQVLPEAHPWRLYLARDDERLATAIKQDSELSYLLLDRLAYKDRVEQWVEAMRTYGFRDGQPDIHMMASGMDISHMYIQQQMAFATPALTIISMYGNCMQQATASELDTLRSNPSSQGLTEVEYVERQQALNRIMSDCRNDISGPFLSKSVYDSYHRALIESGMFVTAKLTLDRRNDLSLARMYTNLLGVFDMDLSQRMGNWLDHLVSSREGKADRRALMADIGNPALGIRLRRRSLDEWQRYASMESAQTMQAVNALFKGLDSRIRHRYQMAELARSHLYHLGLADRLYGSILESEPTRSGRLQSYLAYYNNDTGGLLATAEDISLPDYERISALDYLQTDYEPSNNFTMRIRAVYEGLVQADLKSWSLREDYIKFLKKSGDYTEVARQAKEWLKIHDSNASQFDVWKASIDLSDAYLTQGDLKAAWSVIEPEIDGQYGGILRQAVEIQLAAGRMDKAEVIAQHMHERYPDHLTSLMPLVIVQWRKGEYARAAELLKFWNQPISMLSWRFEIGKQFTEQVQSHGVNAESAFAALMNVGVSVHELNGLSLEFGKTDPARAAALSMQLRAPGLAQISLDLDTYSLLAKANGQDAADEWLRARFRTARQDAVAGIALERHQYAVPWRVAEPERAPYPDAAWLYRAAVYAIGKERSAENGKRLDDYYAKTHGTFYDKLGALVLGKIDEDEIADLPMSNRQISEAAYYLGLRAISDGRYGDGAEWLRVSMETGEQSNGEYRWSLSHLSRWSGYSQSMSVLAARGQLF